MVWAGSPFAHELDFSTGLPVGAVVYSVLGNDGQPLTGYDSISVDPADGAISYLIVVPGAANTVSTPLFENRTLVWNYVTTHGLVSDRISYRVEEPVPFPVSAEGVRRKLGVEPHEVPNEDINLLLAYGNFVERFEENALDAYETSGDFASMVIADAIEATAALMILPSLRLKVARIESSGTNEFQRFATMDWEALEASLLATLNNGIILVDPLDEFGSGIVLIFAVSRTDPLTGA